MCIKTRFPTLLAAALMQMPLLLAMTVEAAPSDQSIKLEPLIEEALKNRPLLKAAKYDADAKGAMIGPSGAYDDPMVSFTAMNYPSDTFSAGEFGMTGNEIGISQKIPFPGKLGKLRSAARHEFESKIETYHQKKLELVREVKVAFYEYFLAYKQKDILDEEVALLGQIVNVTRSKYTSGKISQAEVLGLQTEEANLRDQILMAERQIRTKTAELSQAIGRKTPSDFPRPDQIKKTPTDLAQMTEQSISEKLLTNNPSLKAMQSDFESADEKLSFAKWNYLPNFEFKAAYLQRVQSPGDRGVDFVSGGVALSIPLWFFNKQSEEVRGAKAERAKAEALLDEERLHRIHQVRSIFFELQEADRRLKLYEGGLLPLSRQAILSGQSAYLTKSLDYASLINLVKNRFRTEYTYFEALVNYESKLAELEALLDE